MTVAAASFGRHPSPSPSFSSNQACSETERRDHQVASSNGPSLKRKEASLGSSSSQCLQRYPANRSYQATPFHPLVHQRNPIRVGEHSSASQQPQSLQYHGHHGMISDRPRLACDPPVSEIHIPVDAGSDQTVPGHDGDDDHSWVNGDSGEANDYDELSFERLESWKSMYFVAQRDLHVAREEAQVILDENKRLKRHLFELQRRLYDSQRKRQRLANDMWKVPGAPGFPPAPSSRRQVSSSSQDTSQQRLHKTVKIQEHHKLMDVGPAHHHLVPRAISTEESSAKSNTSLLPHA